MSGSESGRVAPQDLWKIHGEVQRELTDICGEAVAILTPPIESLELKDRPGRIGRGITSLFAKSRHAKPDAIEARASLFEEKAFGPIPFNRADEEDLPVTHTTVGYHKLPSTIPPGEAEGFPRYAPFAAKEGFAYAFDMHDKTFFRAYVDEAGPAKRAFLRRACDSKLLHDIATGRHAYGYAIHTRTFEDLWLNNSVGEYGPDFALGALRAVHSMVGHPGEEKIDALRRLAGSHEDTLFKHTTFGRKMGNVTSFGEDQDYERAGRGLFTTLQEGDLSIMQTINLLTAERVRGFETATDLWAAIKKAQLVEQLTRKLTFGTLAPLSLMGAYIPGLVQPDRENGVRLNPDVVAYLDERRESIVKDYIREWTAHKQQDSQTDEEAVRQYGQKNPIEALGLYCPGVMRGGGLAVRHSVLFDRYQQVAQALY